MILFDYFLEEVENNFLKLKVNFKFKTGFGDS
jgi:hypothetical protein